MNHDQIEGIASVFRDVPKLTEIEVKHEGMTLRLRRSVRSGVSSPRPPVTLTPDSQVPVVVVAQHVGTFQSLGDMSPLVGATVKAGQLLGRVDTMRLLSDCAAPCTGKLLAIHVEAGQPVEYGQPLFEIQPEESK
jgi:acetyl-CoA carboxylase biotin carboxyl carrier protein